MEETLLGLDLPTDLIRHVIIPQMFSLSEMVKNRLYNTILGLNMLSNMEKYPLDEIILTLIECCKHNYPPVFSKIYDIWNVIYLKKSDYYQINSFLLCCVTYLKSCDNQPPDIYKCFLDDYIFKMRENGSTICYEYSFGQILMQLTMNDEMDMLLYTAKSCLAHGIEPSFEMRYNIPKMILELNPDRKHSDVACILQHIWFDLPRSTGYQQN